MVAFVAFLSVPSSEAGCAGDCMTCHPKLEGSPDHRSLKTCIKCHKAAENKNLFPSALSAEGCGTRCFDCHNQWPSDGWHADLNKCGKCHTASKDMLKK